MLKSSPDISSNMIPTTPSRSTVAESENAASTSTGYVTLSQAEYNNLIRAAFPQQAADVLVVAAPVVLPAPTASTEPVNWGKIPRSNHYSSESSRRYRRNRRSSTRRQKRNYSKFNSESYRAKILTKILAKALDSDLLAVQRLKEIQHCQDNKLCFHCEEPGHEADACSMLERLKCNAKTVQAGDTDFPTNSENIQQDLPI